MLHRAGGKLSVIQHQVLVEQRNEVSEYDGYASSDRRKDRLRLVEFRADPDNIAFVSKLRDEGRQAMEKRGCNWDLKVAAGVDEIVLEVEQQQCFLRFQLWSRHTTCWKGHTGRS